jgi:hypothetical protein
VDDGAITTWKGIEKYHPGGRYGVQQVYLVDLDLGWYLHTFVVLIVIGDLSPNLTRAIFYLFLR